jgi:heme A synthase
MADPDITWLVHLLGAVLLVIGVGLLVYMLKVDVIVASANPGHAGAHSLRRQ